MSEGSIRGGFTGEFCGKCHKKVNVELWQGKNFPAGGPPGFHCECGHWNVMSLTCHMIPHKYPDFTIR